MLTTEMLKTKTFQIRCPACNTESVTTLELRYCPPQLKCGECLFWRTEFVDMICVEVK